MIYFYLAQINFLHIKLCLQKGDEILLENHIKTFSLFVRPDEQSEKIANSIRQQNAYSKHTLIETQNGDLIIAIGGDGTFLHAVTQTNFSKDKVYVGVHTGTLGFLQNLSENDIYTLIKYLSYEQEISTRKVLIPSVRVSLSSGNTVNYKAFNEILVCGKDYTKIQFSEYINDEFFQEVSGNGIIISSGTGDTAYSMNAGGAIDFSSHFQLICTLLTPIKNAVYGDFISNPIICPKISVVPQASRNIQIIIDGIPLEISPELIKSIEVSMLNGESYINKLEITAYSKVQVIREKILGYKR